MEKVYAEGLSAKEVTTKFGNILKLNIKAEDFINFLNSHKNEGGWVSIDVLEKKDKVEGKPTHYGVLNTFQPKGSTVTTDQVEEAEDSLPF